MKLGDPRNPMRLWAYAVWGWVSEHLGYWQMAVRMGFNRDKARDYLRGLINQADLEDLDHYEEFLSHQYEHPGHMSRQRLNEVRAMLYRRRQELARKGKE